MPIFKPIPENEAKGKVKEIYDEIKKVRKITAVPNFWKNIANSGLAIFTASLILCKTPGSWSDGSTTIKDFNS